jgi:hypothetical protein
MAGDTLCKLDSTEYRSRPMFVHTRLPPIMSQFSRHRGRISENAVTKLTPLFFIGVFCRILDFITSLFHLLPGFFYRLIDLLAGALPGALFFLVAG